MMSHTHRITPSSPILTLNYRFKSHMDLRRKRKRSHSPVSGTESSVTTTSTPPRSSDVESIDSGAWSINVNVLSRFFSLFSVLWASENKYRRLSSFTKWVQDTIFFPLPRVCNVMAEATVKEGAIFSTPVGCSECAGRLRTSDIVTQVEAVAWRDVGDADLTRIVSCRLKKSMCLKHNYTPFQDRRLFELATSVRGALVNSFSNGQSKTIVSDIVSLAR